MEYYPQMGRRNVNVMKEFRGLATTDKFTTNESYATVSKNLDADSFPAMKTRPKRMRYATNMEVTATGIQGLFRYKGTGASNTFDMVLAVNGGDIYKHESNQWTKIYDIGLPASSTAPIATYDWYMALFDVSGATNIIMSNGTTGALYRYDGTTVTTFTPGIASGIHFPNYITEHENRLFAAIENRVHCSAFRLYTDWTSVEETAVIYTDLTDGEVINGLYSGQDRLLVFKPNNMYELFGVDKSDFRLVKVAEDIGIINGKCVTSLGGVTYFLHTTGVYAYTGGRPRRMSDVVQKYIDAIPANQQKNCFVGTDGKRLFVNLGNDVMLVWHSEYNVWNEWTGFNARCMMSGKDVHLFGSTDSNTYGFNLPHASETSVPFTWTSTAINTGLLSQRHRINRMWLTSDIQNATFHIYLSKKPTGEEWTEVTMINETGFNQVKRVIPTTTIANAKVIRIKIQGAGDCTIHELIRESRIYPLV